MKTKSVVGTHRLNLRLRHYDVETIMVPFDHAASLVEAFETQRASITNDRHLTNEGKMAALAKARDAARAAINEWHEQRIKNLNADLLQQRAALLGGIELPDAKRVDLMTAHLLKHAPTDVQILYNAATEPERREMEAASTFVGRVPVKSANGLEWKPLLDPEMVNEAILTRAEATNPTAAQRLRELYEIRAIQTTIAGVALSDL